MDWKKYIGLFMVVFFMALNSSGQKLTIKLADKAFHEFAWNEAIDLYTYVHERDPENVYVIRRLADCYKNMMNTEMSEYWYGLLVEMEQEEPEDLFYYAQALKSNGKYKESETYLKLYAEVRPEDGRVNTEQSILEYINFLVQDSSRYIVENVSFNTKGSDWGPTIYDNKIIYVSSGDPDDSRGIKYNWDNLPFLDLYFVNIDEYGNYSEPKVFAENLMTSFHDGPATFSPAENRMYYNSNMTTKNSPRSEEGNNLQIYYADLVGEKWQYKGGFKYNNDFFNYGHPSIDPEGEVLYFSSDRAGGKGKNDIWWCRKVNGEWGEPINLEAINTEGNEVFPFIAHDSVLYFSSDGLGGMGELDIYMALPDRGVFANVENLGFPVNTSHNDFGITLDETGMHGYFSSDRPGGKGFDDIYEVDILRIPVLIHGIVKDKVNTFELEGARVALLDENLDTLEIAFTKEDGEFLFSAFKQRNYKLAVSRQDYLPGEKEVSTYNRLPNEKIEVEISIEMDFEMMDEPDRLEPLSLEEIDGQEIQIIQIEHINYDFDSDAILPDAARILNIVTELVEEYPDLEIIVESHTDSKGSDEYNLALSKRRANSAFDYLVKNGIDGAKIEYTGYGETRLLNHCDDGVECTDVEHSINRRSIIKVVRRGTYKTKRNARSLFFF